MKWQGQHTAEIRSMLLLSSGRLAAGGVLAVIVDLGGDSSR